MNELALFAGAGGGLYGTLLLGWRPICAVERDRYRRACLLARQRDGTFPQFAIHDDVRTFPAYLFRGRVDVVTAGFPCQPFSLAGSRKGHEDERNLWPETIRVIRDVRPRFAFLENVPGLLRSGYFGRVLGDLAECGYDAEWCVLGADDVGAPHRRKRLWILAYADAGRLESERSCGLLDGERTALGNNADGRGGRCSWWNCDPADEGDGSESTLGLLVNGLADRSNGAQVVAGPVPRVASSIRHRREQLAALGDGQVPAVVRAAWHLLKGRIET